MRIEVGPQAAVLDTTVESVVTERSMRAFAAGVDDLMPPVFDPEHPAGMVAHPLYPITFEWPLIRDGVPGLQFPDGGVHAGIQLTHDLQVHRPIRSGDRLRTAARLVRAEPRSIGVFTQIELSTTDHDGTRVTDTRMSTLYLGGQLINGHPRRVDPPLQPAAAEVVDVDTFNVDVADAVVYSECSGIWNPIHTDARVARQLGFAQPIMHGTAVLARCVSLLLAAHPEHSPAKVCRVSASFAAAVPLPSTVTVAARRCRDSSGLIFSARTTPTSFAIRSGTVAFR